MSYAWPMEQLRQAVHRALLLIDAAIEDEPLAREGFSRVAVTLASSCEHADAGDSPSALASVDKARKDLRDLAMVKPASPRGPRFELMNVEDNRREALKILDRVPRAVR